MPEAGVSAALQNHAIRLYVHVAQLQCLKGAAFLDEGNQILVSG